MPSHIPHSTARCSLAGGRGSKGAAGKRSLFLLYMDAVSIVNQRAANDSGKNTDQLSQPIDHLPAHQATSFTLRDLHFIIKFAKVIGIQLSASLGSVGVVPCDAPQQSFCAVEHSQATLVFIWHICNHSDSILILLHSTYTLMLPPDCRNSLLTTGSIC